ncbi:MAG: hypothetical protein WC231_01165 [Dehalococcoidales bacterium]
MWGCSSAASFKAMEDKNISYFPCPAHQKAHECLSASEVSHDDLFVWETGGFYEYYQITFGDANDIADEFEPREKKELESRMEGSHSLFGLIWSIQKETGWTHEYILWGESWLQLQLKLADAPGYVKDNKHIISPENWDDEISKLAL